MNDPLSRSIDQLIEAVQVLSSDVQAAAKLSEAGDTQFARRAYVRAAFALVEGNMNLMAQAILDAGGRGEIQLSVADREILRQERTTRDSNGIMVSQVKFVSIINRIAPLFDMFARFFGKQFGLDKSRQGWVDFRSAIDLRNRITHPKNAQSFAISNAELDCVERARQWFADSVRELLTHCFG